MANSRSEPGYGVCYLDGRPGVDRHAAPPTQQHAMPDSPLIHADAPEARWLAWGRSAFAVIVVVVLAALGVANVALYSRWHEVEDGVLWSGRAEGVTAAEVAPASAAASAGIRP